MVSASLAAYLSILLQWIWNGYIFLSGEEATSQDILIYVHTSITYYYYSYLMFLPFSIIIIIII